MSGRASGYRGGGDRYGGGSSSSGRDRDDDRSSRYGSSSGGGSSFSSRDRYSDRSDRTRDRSRDRDGDRSRDRPRDHHHDSDRSRYSDAPSRRSDANANGDNDSSARGGGGSHDADAEAAPAQPESTSTWDPVKEAQNDPDWARIYISNLPSDVTSNELQEMFGAIGVIAREKQKRGYKDQWPFKIKVYTDDSGKAKGDAVLTYEDSNAARTAPSFFNGTSLCCWIQQVSRHCQQLTVVCLCVVCRCRHPRQHDQSGVSRQARAASGWLDRREQWRRRPIRRWSWWRRPIRRRWWRPIRRRWRRPVWRRRQSLRRWRRRI